MVCDFVPVLPQASVTVQLFVVVRVHPEPVSAPSLPEAVKPVLQLSETVAEPNAALTCAAVGLQPREEEAASVITGAVTSLV